MTTTLVHPGTFTSLVVDEKGLVNATRLAEAANLQRAELAGILGARPKQLTDSPTALKIQRPAMRFVQMLDELAVLLREPRYVRFWLRSPQRDLDDESPLYWLQRGKLDEIHDHVARLARHQPD